MSNNSLLYTNNIGGAWTIGFDVNHIVQLAFSGQAYYSPLAGMHQIPPANFLFTLNELSNFNSLIQKIVSSETGLKETIWINQGSEFLEIFVNAGTPSNAEANLRFKKGVNEIADMSLTLAKQLPEKILEIQEIIARRPKKQEHENIESFVNNRKKNSSDNLQRVFVVHGHSQGTRETVARFVEQLGIDVVILHEQVNKGRTIIEKFFDFSDVNYALILLTGDDQGGIRGLSFEKQALRARQNVILELGFFLGKLGRDKVCTLYEEGVEIPSDYSGVLFIPLDNQEAWKIKLAKELKAAGLKVDTSKII